jgi:amino acid adenylation domain-containing protein
MSISKDTTREGKPFCLNGPPLENNLGDDRATIPQLIDRRAKETPNATALCFGNETLTYGEVQTRSNRLAHFLQSKGLGVGCFVGVCLDGSFEMPIALLGIMKSGAAYVPLDPTFPEERLKYTIADAGIKYVLSTTDYAPVVANFDVEILKLDSLSLDSFPDDVATTPSLSDLPAYLIYTSGSTGKPKGVMVPHAALTNFMLSMQITPGISRGDRMLALTTISFDISGLELYLPLVTGASVRLLTRKEARNSVLLNQLTESGEITIIQATPTTWRMMLNSGWRGHPKLKVLVGGEAFPPALAKEMLDKCGEIWNMYGPTETTIWSAIAPVTDTEICIGKPIHNTRIYLLEDDEIGIGGKGLALGYKDRPELTAEKFIYSEVAGERIYRTGDRGRIDSNGRLHFLGRLDHQVKVNGFRIETGEIEAQIDEDEGVRQSLVTVKSYGENDSRLVAYIVPKVQTGRVEQWETVWSNTHSQKIDISDATFNYVGYNNSFTGKPMPEAEMREWSENTIQRIRSLNPTKVLEVGCGTGILLFAIAPDVERYVGTDISQSALSYIREQLDKNPELSPKVELHHRPADALPELEPGSFDVIILNSVVQYFPSGDYLEAVVKKLLSLLGPQGSIFIGDVRNLLLLNAFHKKLLEATTGREVSDRQVQQSVSKEEELVIDPEWFLALKKTMPAIAEARIMPKAEHSANEFTSFRYDAILSTGSSPAKEVEWQHWQEENWTKSKLRQVLSEKPPVLALQAATNSLIDQSKGDAAIQPSDCFDLGAEYNYQVRASWANSDETGIFDVAFLQDESAKPAFPEAIFPEKGRDLPKENLTNCPMLFSLGRQLEPRLRKRLRQFLPDYMIPKAFIFIDRFPQTPNGKIDRKALPEPEIKRPALANNFEKPQTDEESLLAELWTEVLQIEGVGTTDNFFDLGGSSILLTLLYAKIQERFEKKTENTNIIDLFQYPTIQQQAAYLRNGGSLNGSQESEERVAKRVERSTPALARRNLRKNLKNR